MLRPNCKAVSLLMCSRHDVPKSFFFFFFYFRIFIVQLCSFYPVVLEKKPQELVTLAGLVGKVRRFNFRQKHDVIIRMV